MRQAKLYAVVLALPVALACEPKKDLLSEVLGDASPAAAPPAPSFSPPAKTAATTAPKRARPDCAPGPGTVEFYDKNLEKEVRRKLQKPDGAIAKSNLAAVRSLNLAGMGVTNELDPCLMPLFTGLHALFFGPGDVDDLLPITNLTTLESLRAAPSKVSDLRPIEGLVHLDVLDLSHSNVTDIKSLAHLTNITELQLDEDAISDLTPLKGCTKLEMLSIKKTMVHDLSPLSGLKKLKKLYIADAPIDSTAPIQALVASGLKLFTTE